MTRPHHLLGCSLSDRRRGEAYAVLAAVAWSSAGILQRQLTVGVTTQVAGRSAFAFIALAVYVLALQRSARRVSAPDGATRASAPLGARRVSASLWAARASASPGAAGASPSLGALVVAACMAVANAAFILALNHSTVAHVLFFQALAPLVAALLGTKLLGERLNLATSVAMLVAIGGVVVMVGGPGGGSDLGNGLALLTAVAFAIVVVVARRHRGVSMAPAICLSQLLVVLAFGPFIQITHVHLIDVGWLAALGVGQVALGSLLFAMAARLVPAAEMALIFLLEIVLGPLWTWIGISERPSAATLVGGGVVLVAVLLQIGARRSPGESERLVRDVRLDRAGDRGAGT